MSSHSSNDESKRALDESVEKHPEAEHGSQGEMANENRQAGPNSDAGGQPIAPQMGDPRAKDRRPN